MLGMTLCCRECCRQEFFAGSLIASVFEACKSPDWVIHKGMVTCKPCFERVSEAAPCPEKPP